MEELEKKLNDIKNDINELKKVTDMLIIQKEILEKLEDLSDTERIDKEVI